MLLRSPIIATCYVHADYPEGPEGPRVLRPVWEGDKHLPVPASLQLLEDARAEIEDMGLVEVPFSYERLPHQVHFVRRDAGVLNFFRWTAWFAWQQLFGFVWIRFFRLMYRLDMVDATEPWRYPVLSDLRPPPCLRRKLPRHG